MKKLTPKQQRFVDEYLKDLNATQACLRAGFSTKNAHKIGSQLLGKTRIKDEIDKRKEKLAKKFELSHEWILKELKINHEKAREVGDFTASNKAIELMGKHIGTFADRIKHSNDGDKPLEVKLTVNVNERINEILSK